MATEPLAGRCAKASAALKISLAVPSMPRALVQVKPVPAIVPSPSWRIAPKVTPLRLASSPSRYSPRSVVVQRLARQVMPSVSAVKSSVIWPLSPRWPPLATGCCRLMTLAALMPESTWLLSIVASIAKCFDTLNDCVRPNAAKLRLPYSAMSCVPSDEAIRAPDHGVTSKPSRPVRALTALPLAIS